MNINIENYEAYMLDLIEGNISSVDKAKLYEFLDKNSELHIDISEFEDVKLTAENKSYKNKNSLKKDASIHIQSVSEINRLSIAYLENDITRSESAILENLLKKQPKKQFDFDIIQQTKLQVEKNIKFKHKSKLKKKIVLQKYVLKIAYSIAAILILFIGFSFIFNQTTIVKTSINKIAYIGKDIKIRELKKNKMISVFKSKNYTKTFIKVIDNDFVIEIDTNRVEEQIAFLNNIKTEEVFYKQNSINLDNLTKNRINYSNNIDYSINEKEISKKLKQLLNNNNLKNYKEITFESVVNNFKKLIKKKFHIKKTITDDNRKIIAFKAGNREYYISRANSKKR